MLAIHGLKCIYDTGARRWAIELSLDGEGEEARRRFEVDGRDDAKMLIAAFEDASYGSFDPASGEIVFAYEYADFGIDEDHEDEEDDEEEEDDDEAEAGEGDETGKKDGQ